MLIQEYTSEARAEWDEFVDQSKNGTFLFKRDYMEYHADRFTDCSYIFRDDKGKPLALFPATIHDDEVRSHGGLTYGGLVMNAKTHCAGPNSPLTMLPMLVDTLRQRGIKTLIYKPVPYIYHSQPSEEDLYVLWRMGATVSIRNLSSVIDLQNPIHSTKLNNRAVNSMRRFSLTCEATDCAADFWHILEQNRMSRYGVKPAHTAQEMQMLRDRFPDQIKFFVVKDSQGVVVSCFVIYLCGSVIHSQYPATSPEGMELHAEDVGFHEILHTHLADGSYRYLDFGTNNEDDGRYLNESLALHKERFGARTVCYDTYCLSIG